MTAQLAETLTLWRPIGQAELDLITESGWRRFQPGLPGQPIFYPVLKPRVRREDRARLQHEEPGFGNVGYVVRFDVGARYGARFEPRRLRGPGIDEPWVPAEEPVEFNEHIRRGGALVSEHRP